MVCSLVDVIWWPGAGRRTQQSTTLLMGASGLTVSCRQGLGGSSVQVVVVMPLPEVVLGEGDVTSGSAAVVVSVSDGVNADGELDPI